MATERGIVIPKPVSLKQRIIVEAFHQPDLLEVWVACGTKFGKSLGASAGACSRLPLKKGSLGRWIAPIYSQAKIGFKYCKKILPPEPECDINKSEPSITLVALDSKIEFKSGKFAEDLEGEGTDFNILDEAAKMQQQVYDSTKTTTTVTRGIITAFSTPRGKNWFYHKCMEAKEKMEWSIKNGKSITHMFITAPSSDNPLVLPAAIEEARLTLPDRLFRQYYLAEFIDDGAVFVGFRECVEPMELLRFDAGGKHKQQHWLHEDAKECSVAIGADWAKSRDMTVFWAFDIRTRRTVGFYRFYKTPYTEAIRRLHKFAKSFAEVIIINHDKTGLGNVIDDYLAQTELPYQGVTFTPGTKNDMVTKLITGTEQQDFWLPNWQEMIDELDAYEVLTTPTGNMTYGAPEGKHDDIVTAMMLAYLGLIQYGDSSGEVVLLGDKPKASKTATIVEGNDKAEDSLSKFYRELAEDTDDDLM